MSQSSLPLEAVGPGLLESLIFGAVSVEATSSGLRPWRLDCRDAAFIHPELMNRVLATSGVGLRFHTDAEKFQLLLGLERQMGPEDVKTADFDLFLDGKYHSTFQVEAGTASELLVEGLPVGEKLAEVYFPTDYAVTLAGMELPADSALRTAAPRSRWVTHGSSITHCRAAASPGFTWPALVAAERGWDGWNLGFGGQCKFDQVVARSIARMPADRISLCLGINTVANLYALRTWVPAVEGFIMTVRDGHPKTPLLIVSPILSPPREESEGEATLINLTTMRRCLEEAVQKFRAAGDQHIYYLDGRRIIGPGDEATMPDQLHPDADGIKLMARRFLEAMPPDWAK